jgi:imidazoleglycerol-phosphate dehydratase
MLDSLARHARFDLTVRAEGDLHVDQHHTAEDVGITLGQALDQALGERRGIRRFGDALVPLDEALTQCAVDLSGRPYLVHAGEPPGHEQVMVGPAYVGSLTRHVFESITAHAALCVHLRVLSGRDPHHIVESQFKAFARALREAAALDPREQGIPSTKGSL